QPLCKHQQEKGLRFGCAVEFRIERVGKAFFEPAADALETADLAVMHERPAARNEGMAIVAAGRAAGRGAHMREEQAGPYLSAQAPEIAVGPGRKNVAIAARLRPLAIPGKAETVAIGGRLGLQRLVALRNQGMAGCRYDVFQEDRL